MLEANLGKTPSLTFNVAVPQNGFDVLVVRIPKTFELEEVCDNENIAELGENNK